MLRLPEANKRRSDGNKQTRSNTIMKIKAYAAGAAVLGAMTMSSMALGIPSSGTVLFVNPTGPDIGNGSAGGGEFYIDVAPFGAAGSWDFKSFCLEHGSSVSIGSSYNYTVNALQGAVNGGPGASGGKDVISRATAWLYASFANGSLTTVFGGNYDETEENELQNAIWYLENETNTAGNNYFVAKAQSVLGATYLNDATYGEFGTYVLNVGTSPAFGNQDILYYWSVPDGGTTLFILGLGIVTVGAARRRIG